jgi:hypothetical protein
VTVKPLPSFLAAGLRKPAITKLLTAVGAQQLPPPPPGDGSSGDGNGEGKEDGGGGAAAAAAAAAASASASAAAAAAAAAGPSSSQEGGAEGAAAAAAVADDAGSLSEMELEMRLAQRLPLVLRDALKAYQWVGAKFVIRRGGRGLIGDEMGACACVNDDDVVVVVVVYVGVASLGGFAVERDCTVEP